MSLMQFASGNVCYPLRFGYAPGPPAQIVVLCRDGQTGVGRCEDNGDTFLFTLSSGRGKCFR